MPIISFKKKSWSQIKVGEGANLMKALLDSEVPVASSCHGEAVCGKCWVTVVDGEKNISPPNDNEVFLREKFQLNKNQRISCQVLVLGDIEIDTTYW